MIYLREKSNVRHGAYLFISCTSNFWCIVYNNFKKNITSNRTSALARLTTPESARIFNSCIRSFFVSPVAQLFFTKSTNNAKAKSRSWRNLIHKVLKWSNCMHTYIEIKCIMRFSSMEHTYDS